MHKHNTFSSGFSIVELIIVVVVVAIIAAVSIVGYNGIQQNARDNSLLSDIDAVESELARYAAKNGGVYGAALNWHSGSGSNANIAFSPSAGNIIDVVTGNGEFCIRAFNPAASYSTAATATSKGSSDQACLLVGPSLAAGGSGGAIQGWYKLNGNAIDSSGNNRNGTVSGATLTDGQNGAANTAYAFSTTATQSINTNYNFPYNRITATAWIKPAGTSVSSYGSIISNARDCCATYNGIHISQTRSPTEQLSGRIWNGGGGPAATINATALSTGVWKHIAMTYDGTVLRLYVDGAQVGSNNFTTATLGSSAFNVFIGRGGWSNSYSFGGAIDDVRLYDYALTAAEIQKMFSLGAS